MGDAAAPTGIKLIPVRETRARFGGISAMTDWRWRRDGLLPAPLSINKRNHDVEPEIETILSRRAAGATDDDVRGLVADIMAARSTTDREST